MNENNVSVDGIGNVPEENSETLLLHEIHKFEEFEESVEKYRKVAQAAIAQWIRDFKNEKIKLNTVDDLERLIRIDLQLQRGEF